MGIITREPESLQRAVHREALLELKRLNDEYVCLVDPPPPATDTPPQDLFTQHQLDPTAMYRDDLLTPRNDYSMAVTIAEPNRLDFYQYGLECRYLPLFRYLQLSKKAVLTEDWRVAREELLFSRAFDRCLELRQLRALSTVVPKRVPEPPREQVYPWDIVLQHARWMFIDIAEEAKWKRALAKEVAEEAVQFLKLKFKLKRRPFHYSRDLLNYLDRETMIYGDQVDQIQAVDIVCEQLSQMNMQWAAQDETVPVKASPIDTVFQCTDCTPHIDDVWTDDEDAFLRRSLSVYTGTNLELMAEVLGKSVDSCRHRIHTLESTSEDRLVEAAAIRHSNLISIILSHLSHQPTNATTQPRSTRPLHSASQAAKKLQSAAATVHPSHEAAVRKANQNINKLLTPGELAMRRLQRNRVMAGDVGGGAILQPPTMEHSASQPTSSTTPSNPPSPKK